MTKILLKHSALKGRLVKHVSTSDFKPTRTHKTVSAKPIFLYYCIVIVVTKVIAESSN